MLLIYLIVLGISINFANNASLSNQELKKYKNLIEGQGLYTADEDVYVLTSNNFRKQLYGKPHANLVEFYNSWCGFCQRFQPTWSALGTDIKNWKDRVVISAIDCSDDDNSPICRDFEIMSYPTLRYFHEDYVEKAGNIGVDIPKGLDMHEHKTELLKQIVREQNEGLAKMFSNIIPYAFNNLSHIYDTVGPNTQYIFLIIEPAANIEMLGAEVAIELQKIKNITVKYAITNNTEILKHANVGVTVFSRNDRTKPTELDISLPHSRESIIVAIKNYLHPRNIFLPSPTSQKDIFTGKWYDAKVPNSDDLQQAREKLVLLQKVKKMGDVVFQVDLETALRYSLRREIALSKTITGEKHAALQKYLSVLVKYFPFGPRGRDFLQNLLDRVTSSSGTIDGKTIADLTRDAEKPEKLIFSSLSRWLGCEGSLATSRGYPCGLWKLFHYLTVNAAESNINNDQANPLEILDAMLGYIKHFFGCTDCSQHFQEMAEEKDMKSVGSLDSSIMWLWMAHNAANKRLAGDTTEDPEYPKIQYPSPANCPTCRNLDKTWNLQEVLRYLKTVYSNINVRYIGSDTRILHLGLEGVNSNLYDSSSSIFKQLDTTSPLQQKDLRT